MNPYAANIDFKEWLQSLTSEETKAVFERIWNLYDGCSTREERE